MNIDNKINTMTYLQDELIKRMEYIFENTTYETSEGKRKLNVYGQYLPSNSNDKTIFPLIQVKVINGNIKEDDKNCSIGIIVGIHDSDRQFRGYKTLMNALEKILEYLEKHKIYGIFEEKDLSWDLTEDNLFPFFIAGIEINFENKNKFINEEYC